MSNNTSLPLGTINDLSYFVSNKLLAYVTLSAASTALSYILKVVRATCNLSIEATVGAVPNASTI